MAIRIEGLFKANSGGSGGRSSGTRAGEPEGKKRKHGEAAGGGGAGAALSFAVVVPGWPLDPGIARLRAHPSLRLSLAVPKADHGFCDGAQHQRRDRYRDSPYDTYVLVLQNDAAAARWPCTGPPPPLLAAAASGAAGVANPIRSAATDGTRQSLAAALLEAFALAKPTAAAVARRATEGRGFADADGGGGVFKGKKKRKDAKGPGASDGVAIGAGKAKGAASGKEGGVRTGKDGKGSSGTAKKRATLNHKAAAPTGGGYNQPKSRVVKHGDGTVSFL
jgi:hypothetical protein